MSAINGAAVAAVIREVIRDRDEARATIARVRAAVDRFDSGDVNGSVDQISDALDGEGAT